MENLKAKLQALLTKSAPYVQAAVAKWPFPAGVVVGYYGSPFIKLALEAAWAAVKHA